MPIFFLVLIVIMLIFVPEETFPESVTQVDSIPIYTNDSVLQLGQNFYVGIIQHDTTQIDFVDILDQFSVKNGIKFKYKYLDQSEDLNMNTNESIFCVIILNTINDLKVSYMDL